MIPVESPGESDTLEPPLPRPAAVSWDKAGNVLITDFDEVGAAIDCVWTVEWALGRFVVNTITDPSGEEGKFEYLVTPEDAGPESSARTMRGTPPSNSADLHTGTWLVELTNLGEVWELKASRCSETDETTFSFENGPAAALGVDPGDTVVCDFELLGPIIPDDGRWVMRNTKTRLKKCDVPKRVKIPNQKPAKVEIEVGQGGDVLDVTGQSDGKTETIVLPYAGKRTYRGTDSARGGKVKYRYDVKSKTLMVGTITARAKGCEVERHVRLTHAGSK